MTREEIAKELGWAYINVESDLLDRIVRVVRLAEDAERQAIIQIITPSEEHRRDASWGYLGGDEGVELLDNLVERIARRSYD